MERKAAGKRVGALVVLVAWTGAAFGQPGGPDVPVDVGSVVQNEISMALIAGALPGVPQLLIGGEGYCFRRLGVE